MNTSGSLSQTAQAILLLTSYFSKVSSENAKPLTIKEWGKFALWLKDKKLSPADLLAGDPVILLSSWHESRISLDRIVSLLDRGHSLALAVEKWQRAGLWVVTRSDPEYPWRLKQRLKMDSPPVLFGCGDKTLLNQGGLAVIGSRNASDEDLAFTEQVGEKAAEEGIAIVSGGARGVDEAAMFGAMNRGGGTIGVMADSLLRIVTSSKWRKSLVDGRAVLISPFYPEAGFSAGNAMARNKYIYCLADTSLVVHSGKKGGTLSGADENLKKKWVPLWVKPTSDKNAANADLVGKGGQWCVGDIPSLRVADLFKQDEVSVVQTKETDLFSASFQSELFDESTYTKQARSISGAQKSPAILDQIESGEGTKSNVEDSVLLLESVDFYQIFVAELSNLAQSPVTVSELAESTDLHKSQLNDWLKRAVSEGVVKKMNRPVRYQVV